MAIWFSVLDYWCNKKVPLGSGLTIPYLIGAEFLLTNNLKTIEDFLNELISDSKNIYSIRFCDNIGEYVIQLNEINDFSLNYYPKIGSLTIIDKELIDYLESEELKNHLEKRYKHLIENKQFSIYQGEWFTFSGKEVELIKTCYNNS